MYADKFTRWAKWESREKLRDLGYPGVYALAVSGGNLEGKEFSYLCEIAYFGMTNSIAGLRGRLKQFDNTIRGKTGHGGAERFCFDYPKSEMLVPNLFVAVLPFPCDVSSNAPNDLLVMGMVAMAEYECFSHYASVFGELPRYNNKKSSPKPKRAK